jgi:glucose/mannose-6-phosphate isomerase
VTFDLDESRLDDVEALSLGDPGDMLRSVATVGAQIRRCLTLTAESDLGRLVADGPPRSVVLDGRGTSGLVAELIRVLAGATARIPVVPLVSATTPTPAPARPQLAGQGLPAWVGAMDVLIAISASGTTPATVAAAEEAGRRGSRVLTVGPRGSPLEDASLRARGVHIDPDLDDRPARARLWSLAVPALRLSDGWGLVDASVDLLEAVADLVDVVADRCRPTADLVTNPAKALALDIAGTIPLLYGATPLGALAARRFAATLAADAGYPASVATDESLGLLAGPFTDTAADTGQPDDFFRDRVEDDVDALRLRLVLFHDAPFDAPSDGREESRREVLRRVAEDRGVAVSELTSVGTQPLERVATLTALSDFVSVYLALALGVDPTRTIPLE